MPSFGTLSCFGSVRWNGTGFSTSCAPGAPSPTSAELDVPVSGRNLLLLPLMLPSTLCLPPTLSASAASPMCELEAVALRSVAGPMEGAIPLMVLSRDSSREILLRSRASSTGVRRSRRVDAILANTFSKRNLLRAFEPFTLPCPDVEDTVLRSSESILLAWWSLSWMPSLRKMADTGSRRRCGRLNSFSTEMRPR